MVAATTILLVEDNPRHAELTVHVLMRAKRPHEVHRVSSGDDALAFLRREGRHRAAPTPALILLDLNLPGMEGLQVLATIKNDELWRRIPVVVVTSAARDSDVAESYALHANAVVEKPVDGAAFLRAIDSIEQFWLQTAKLP
jgi:CheY-like chemotaxis protein